MGGARVHVPCRSEGSISNGSVYGIQRDLWIECHCADMYQASCISTGTVCPGAVDIDRRIAVSLALSMGLPWGRRLVGRHRLKIEEDWQVSEVSWQPGPSWVPVCNEVAVP